jgi:hypothetical protein
MRLLRSTILALASISIVTNCYSNEIDSRIEVKNYETQGNLESKHELGCLEERELKNDYTPADLYRSFNDCAKKGKLKEGALTHALAGVYGKFDTLRVTDKSAHQALTVLKMQAFNGISEEQQISFKTNLSQIFTNPEKLAAVCKVIRKTGRPNYYPAYMIQHGMSAFTKKDSKNDLIKNFNPNLAWEDSLENYLHCKK